MKNSNISKKHKSEFAVYKKKLKKYNTKQLERELDILKLEESFYDSVPKYITIILSTSGVMALYQQYTEQFPILVGVFSLIAWGMEILINHFKKRFHAYLKIEIKRKYVNKELELKNH